MKVNYRGFEIEVTRQRAIGGDEMLYYSIFGNGREMCYGRDFPGRGRRNPFAPSDRSVGVRAMIDCLKQRVDAEIASGNWK